MRQDPRFDTRKEALKKDIRHALLECKDYLEFERKMIQKGYEVIKGRGIAFRDQKKMYVKGSELGYSLTSIEKILQLTLSQKQALLQRQIQNESPLKSQSKSFSHQVSKSMAQNQELDFSRTIEILLRTEFDSSVTPHEFLKKKRKPSSHHL